MKHHRVSGADHFHVLVDREMRHRQLPGNMSRMLFTFGAGTNVESMAQTLATNTFFNEVRSIGLKLSWPSLPHWERFSPTDTGMAIRRKMPFAGWLDECLARPILHGEGAIRIEFLEDDGQQSHALITFNHAVFDHQGMINALHGLNRGSWDGPLFSEPENFRVFDELRQTLVAAAHAFSASGPRMASLVKLSPKPQTHYVFLDFSEAETIKIKERSGQAGFNLYVLGTMAMAVGQLLANKGSSAPYLWFSTPHSLRKKGTAGHVVGNAMSFFFYRLRGDLLGQMAQVADTLHEQLRDQVRHHRPNAYAALLRSFRWVPMPLFSTMFRMPSWGRWATFANSDLGNLDRMPAQFLGADIVATRHYPPVPSPPGLCFATGLEGGKLRITIGHTTHALSENAGREFGLSLRNMLLQTG